jgi:sugar phosphate isomerase/epimerase
MDPRPPTVARATGRTQRSTSKNAVLMGTVALEPNRWGAISPDRRPHLRAAEWVGRAEAAGFDGIELWEHHATLADDDDLARIESSALPVAILNSYVSFDDESDAAREAVAGWAGRLRCIGVKFNVGNDPTCIEAYIARLRRFADHLPQQTCLVCECHAGTVAEDPPTAKRILEAIGTPERVQALVHLGDDPAHVASMFEALGHRIRHVHVNFLKQGAPVLAEISSDVRERIGQLRRHGFEGSYTIEFVNGVGTSRDTPSELVDVATRDLVTLRDALSAAG